MATKREVRYLNKSFNQFRKNLLEFAKIYFPQTYTDFNETDPGSMFIEMSAYVGDVLSLYDSKLYRENLLLQAQERKNLLNIAQAYGYKPHLSIPSVVTLDLFQVVPAIGSGENIAPDYRYSMQIPANSSFRSVEKDIIFSLVNAVDFNVNTPTDPISVSVYKTNQTTGAPEFYLLKKQGRGISGEIKEVNLQFDDAKRFTTAKIADEKIIKIIDVIDSDGNNWYEVPYLAQDTIFDESFNTTSINPDLAQYSTTVPFLLKLKKVPRRFITRITQTEDLELRFGGGISSESDEQIVPNPDNVGSPLTEGMSKFDTSFDPSNYFLTKTYGQVPSNTTLTVRYLIGGGVESNVSANTINQVVSTDLDVSSFPATNFSLNNLVKTSFAVNNPEPASGGSDVETNEELRQNALSMLSAQNRAVTKSDYIIRAYAMDPKFGSVFKAYIVQDEQLNLFELRNKVINPFTMNLYSLGRDADGHLTTLNDAVKENLKTYLSQYRMLTDSINIKNAYIINIGVIFDIIPNQGFNDNEVLIKCIDVLKSYFQVEKWQINQPIVLGEIYDKLNAVDGVQHVARVSIINNNDADRGYSNVLYNINSATRFGVVYPSIDPSIFEVKFPNRDIIGRIATY